MNPQQRSAAVSLVAAVGLVALKLVTGLLTGSLALLAEAAHSAADLIAAAVTFVAVRISAQGPDRQHQFGHGKAEHLAALCEAALLVVTGCVVAVEAVLRLSGGSAPAVTTSPWVFVVLAVVIVVDVTRLTGSLAVAREFGSAALRANAMHFASDLMGTVAVVFGLVLVATGHPRADAAAALVVAAIVLTIAARLIRDNVHPLMDRAPAASERAVLDALDELEQPVDVRRLRLRESGGRTFVDLVIAVQADVGVEQAHAVADRVEAALEQALPAADVIVHVEPGAFSGDLRERATAAAMRVAGIRELHDVVVRDVATGLEVTLHAKARPDMSVGDATRLAESIEAAIRDELDDVAVVMTHLEPLAGGEGVPARVVQDRREEIAAAVRSAIGTDPLDLALRASGFRADGARDDRGRPGADARGGACAHGARRARRSSPSTRDWSTSSSARFPAEARPWRRRVA